MIWFTTHSLACRSQILFPRGQPKSRTNAPLSATADLDDYDLEGVPLDVYFREAWHRRRRRSGPATYDDRGRSVNGKRRLR